MRTHEVRKRLASVPRSEAGAVLPIFALMITVLIGVAAFATDLGWFYVNASRVQRAAEAAALSGVVELPLSPTNASNVAVTVATNNGYAPGLETTVTPTPQPGGEETQLEVTIATTIDTFFLSVFGIDEQVITRTATAEYLPPLRLGSPQNQFGNACDPRETSICSTPQPNFWANIHGRETSASMGDAYSSYCDSGNNEGCSQSPSYRSEHGYVYGIEVDNPGANFTVLFSDLAHRNNSGGVNTSDGHRTGDRGCEAWGGDGDPDCGMHMQVTLYYPDPTPLDPTDNAPICSVVVAPEPQVAATEPYSWIQHDACLRVLGASAGVYLVEVEVLDTAGDIDDGLNRYGIKAEGTALPRLFGVGDFSLYNNAQGTLTDFYLAEIGEFYRGRTLLIELFDPGEASPGGYVELMQPNGAGWSQAPSCDMYTRNEITQGWSFQGTQAPCQFFATVSSYHDRWVRLAVDLPDVYSCTTNCWWKVNYDYPGTVNDTTTWRAEIVGAPVHLVP